MYIVPILMLLFIGSLVVALICVRVRNCDFEAALNLPGRSTAATTTTNSNGNLRVEIPTAHCSNRLGRVGQNFLLGLEQIHWNSLKNNSLKKVFSVGR